MNTRIFFFISLISCISILLSCENNEPEKTISDKATYIASYSQAHENVLRSIPESYIELARTTLKVAYQHTSHGTHVAFGMYGLPHYKNGDDALLAFLIIQTKLINLLFTTMQ